MTLVLDLPAEVETELRQAAAVRGVAVEDYAVERLRDPLGAADYLWARLCDLQTHNAAILEIAKAPAQVQAIINERGAAAAEKFYATPEGVAELADWRALDGEPFDLGSEGSFR